MLTPQFAVILMNVKSSSGEVISEHLDKDSAMEAAEKASAKTTKDQYVEIRMGHRLIYGIY